MHRLPGTQISVSTKGAHGLVAVGRRWDRVAMVLLDLSITSVKGNRYVLVMVDCFSRWTEAFPFAGQDRGVCGGCFLQQHCMPFRDA